MSGKNTAIFFNKVKPLDAIDSYQFLLRIRKGTKEVFLKEVDPRFPVMAVKSAVNKQSAEAPEEKPENEEESPAEEVPAVKEAASAKAPDQNDADADISSAEPQ